MKKITFISDTHNRHNQLKLIGGDILIHCGDISPNGEEYQVKNFCKWFSKIDNYTNKIFIAGNHDWLFQTNPELAENIVNSFENINYLFNKSIIIDDIKIYGTPYQPYFCNWAFNLPKNGKELKSAWDKIPENTDILITHSPPFGYLDTTVKNKQVSLGCELLAEKIKKIKPKIHSFGHIHSGYGYKFNGNTHFFNASVLNEEYIYTQKPINIEWNEKTNEIIFIENNF